MIVRHRLLSRSREESELVPEFRRGSLFAYLDALTQCTVQKAEVHEWEQLGSVRR